MELPFSIEWNIGKIVITELLSQPSTKMGKKSTKKGSNTSTPHLVFIWEKSAHFRCNLSNTQPGSLQRRRKLIYRAVTRWVRSYLNIVGQPPFLPVDWPLITLLRFRVIGYDWESDWGESEVQDNTFSTDSFSCLNSSSSSSKFSIFDCNFLFSCFSPLYLLFICSISSLWSE